MSIGPQSEAVLPTNPVPLKVGALKAIGVVPWLETMNSDSPIATVPRLNDRLAVPMNRLLVVAMAVPVSARRVAPTRSDACLGPSEVGAKST